MKKFHIFFKDTDPDTGLLSQVKKMCECTEEAAALCIKTALERGDCDDPNREYFISIAEPKAETLILCANPDQVKVARKFQLWCADRGVLCVVCFGREDTATITSTYDMLKVKYMVAIIDNSGRFDEITGWELKMSSFEDEYDFDTVVSLLY